MLTLRFMFVAAAVVLVAAAVALVAAGCSRPRETGGSYLIFGGTVRERSPETGKLHVVVSEPRGSDWIGRTLECVVTSDSELYLNDRFTGLADVQERDSVQVIGYFDRNEQDQFWVTQADVTRPMPPPPVPVLSVPATQPASQENSNVQPSADRNGAGL